LGILLPQTQSDREGQDRKGKHETRSEPNRRRFADEWGNTQAKPEATKPPVPSATRHPSGKPVATKSVKAKPATPTPAKTSRARATEFDGLKVTLLVKENQTREGSGVYPWFRLSLPKIGSE
jgi:hypothetical protein